MKKLSILLIFSLTFMAIATMANADDEAYAYWNVTLSPAPTTTVYCFQSIYYTNNTFAPCSNFTEACSGSWYSNVYAFISANGNYNSWITCRSGTQHYNQYKDVFSYDMNANTTPGGPSYNRNITLFGITDWNASLSISSSSVPGNGTLTAIITMPGDTDPDTGNYIQCDINTGICPGASFSVMPVPSPGHDPYATAFYGFNISIKPNPWIFSLPVNWINQSLCGAQTLYAYLFNSYGEDRRTQDVSFTITGCTPIVTTTTVTTTTTINGTTTTTQGVNNTFLTPVFPIDADEWTAAGYGWLLPFFSVFFLSTMLMIVIVAGAGMVGGPVGGGVAALGMLIVYSVLGIYPMWIALLIGLVGSAIVAKLVMGAVSK